MEEVLRNVNKVLVDKNTSSTGGVLPYLALPEPKPTQPPAPPRTAPPAAPPPTQGATR